MRSRLLSHNAALEQEREMQFLFCKDHCHLGVLMQSNLCLNVSVFTVTTYFIAKPNSVESSVAPPSHLRRPCVSWVLVSERGGHQKQGPPSRVNGISHIVHIFNKSFPLLNKIIFSDNSEMKQMIVIGRKETAKNLLIESHIYIYKIIPIKEFLKIIFR